MVLSRERHRHGSGVRESQLVDAAISVMARGGPGAVSVRTIASEAGMSSGMVGHHFGSIDDLIAAAAISLGASLVKELDRLTDAAGSDPHDRLRAFVSGCFRAPAITRSALSASLAVSGLARSMPIVASAHGRMIALHRARISALIVSCLAPGAPVVSAEVLAAILDGIWAELASETCAVSVDEAEAVALRCLTALDLLPSSDLVE
jgi:TetR/AcrR family transcriptional regulator, transcriptional repressor of bet genes